MDRERWQRMWAAFHDALDVADGAARDAALALALADDPELLAEARALLASHLDGEATFGVRPAAPASDEDEGPEAGELVGPFRVVRRIGVGGMGLVFEAEQEEPLRRRVALKLVKPGMDSREVVRRFEAERQALARMDHGSIARVFDAGATSDGRPWFAMELVDGPPLLAHCDRERLGVAARLALLAAVARAVHSAHQRGILHRDLKPSNVLVATEAGVAVPKVIDFGIARAVDPLAGGTAETRAGMLVGTPEAMSPEQAALSGDLDTRTDVYALGALLYELVAGVPPLELEDVPFAELLRRIREDEPPPPSARFGADADGASERAARRGSEPARLRRELRGEVDWIVARAMAKERERRYGSAAELADDLERRLRDEPVVAGPPGRLYRVRKFLRRHRFEAVAAAVLLAALVAFGVTMAVQSRRLARALEVQERERATATQVSEFLVGLLQRSDPANARGSEPTVKQALDWGTATVERDLAGQPEIEARLLETIGRVQLALGAYEKAAPVLEKNLALRERLHGPEHPDVATAALRLAELELERGNHAASRALAERALAIRRRAPPSAAASTDSESDASPDAATAEALHLVASLDRIAGDFAKAERGHQEAIDLLRRSVPDDDPRLAESYNLLGVTLRQSGQLERAEAAYRRAWELWRKELGPDHPNTTMAMNNLALTLHVRGDHAAAEKLFDELVPLRRKLLGDSHPDFALTLANRAKLYHDTGRLERAEGVYREALAVTDRAGEPTPPIAATIAADLSAVVSKRGRPAEGVELARRSLALRERIFGAEHSTVAASLDYLGEALDAAGDSGAASESFGRASRLMARLAPDSARLADTLVAEASFRLRHDGADRALAILEEAVGIYRRRAPWDDRRRCRAEGALGLALLRVGRRDEARPLLESSLACLAKFETNETAEARRNLAELAASR